MSYKDNLKYLIENRFEHELIIFDALKGKKVENINRDQICKTLVLKGDKSGILIVSIPFSRKLNTKKLRTLTKDRKIRFVDDVESITGYPHGANGPLGIYKNHDEYTYILDSHFNKYSKIVSNIGKYGTTVLSSRKDLELFVGMYKGDVSDPE